MTDKKVLIVDDEVDVQTFVRALLADDGFTVLTAGDGAAAIKKAREEKPDVIILDVQMPGKDGFQAFYELRNDAATKSIPVIMLTAVTQRTHIHFDGRSMSEYLGCEPEDYIDKPIDPERLRRAVKKLTGAA